MTQNRRGGSYPIDRRPQVATLPADYLKEGYFDSNDNIRCDLLTTTAAGVAKVLGDSNITSTQLRKFFIQARYIERMLAQNEFPQLITEIKGLCPAVANYVGRGKDSTEREQRENLKRFIDANVEHAIKSFNHFKKGFMPHFESVVAYYKYQFPRK